MYRYWWVRLEDGREGSVALNEDDPPITQACIRYFKSKAASVQTLPYPTSTACLYRGDKVECPDFCFGYESCRGRTACPLRYACDE